MSGAGKKVTSGQFLEDLRQMAEGFRKKIELEVGHFPSDEESKAERLVQVLNDQTGYRFFAETYFPHYLTAEPSRLHEQLFEDLPAITTSEKGERYLLIAPRGSAKSTHLTLIYPIYLLCRGLKNYICLIMDAFEQAAVMLEAIKAELEINPRLANDFPDIVGQGRVWREDVILTPTNRKIEAFGTGKKIRGRRHGPYRPDLVILDDVENDENVESPKQRDKLQTWIDKAVLKLGSNDGSMDVLFAGTVLHHDSVLVRFAKKPAWRTTTYRAVLKWPERMDLWERFEELFLNESERDADDFYEENRAEMDEGAVVNWPALQPLLYLMKERASNHDAFESEFQNNPVAGDNPFKKLIYWVTSPAGTVLFGAIDPSLGKFSKNRDPSAILVGAYDREEARLDVIEASIRRRLPDVILADAIAMQRQYGCAMWFVESVQFQEFLRTELMKKAALVNVMLPAIPVIPIADKALRIERLQPSVAAGLIRFNSAQTTLIQQLQQWPKADHDDGPDCLEMLYTGAVQYGGGGLTGDDILISTQSALSGSQLGGYRLQ